MNTMALFSLFFTYFVVIFYIFPAFVNRGNGTDISSPFFRVFIVPRYTSETLFGARLYMYSK